MMSMFAMNVKKNVYIRISYLVLDYDEHIHNISHNRIAITGESLLCEDCTYTCTVLYFYFLIDSIFRNMIKLCKVE